MVYLLYGADMARIRAKARTLIAGLLKKQPDASLLQLAQEDTTEDALRSAIGTSGLFFSKAIIVLDGVLGDTALSEAVRGMLSDMAKSDNVFIFIERLVDAKTFRAIEKHATKVEEVRIPPKKVPAPQNKINPFGIADAYSAHNGARALETYYALRAEGMASEEIHGTLLWQIKMLLMVLKAGKEKGLPIKDFPRRKAERALATHTEESLAKDFYELLEIPYAVRMGRGDFEAQFESWLLRAAQRT